MVASHSWGEFLIAETSSEPTFAVRIRPLILTALAAALLACRPGADFKVSVRVIDETTGRPIPDAWVLVSARVDVEPERDPPYNRAIAGARDRTDSRGVAVLKTLEGLYWGEEPKDELWKMLAAREPKVERRITLIKEGDLFVFAKDYGVLHHPLRFKGGSSKEVPGLGLMGVKGEGTVLELDPADMAKGLALTIKMAKPEDTEYLLGSFSPDSLWLFAGLATTGATGTTKKEKAAVYDFFVENLRPLLSQSTGAYHGHMRPESLFDPKNREKFINHAPEQVHNHDTTIHEWMTQKALELLPAGYEEVKQYAREIQAGVKAEDEGTRAINHFYNPYDPANAFPLGESALKWGAIGYPDNPNNEWDWHDAQRYYREGDKAKAYKALGHVLHLLEDLSVPMHTHVIAHHSLFQRSAARYELHFGELAKANGGMLPPVYGMEARAPKRTNALVDLFDGLAKMTFGRIDGNRTAVDIAAFYKWEKGSMGTQVVEPGAAALDIIGRRLLPVGIEYGAGLLSKFFSDLHRPASVSAANGDGASDAAPNARPQNSAPWNPTHKSHKDLKTALAAAEGAPDEQSALKLHKELPGYAVESEADLQAVYERMKNVRARRGTARSVESATEQMMYLSFVIVKATAPKHHDWIARLLEREYDELPWKYAGVWGALTKADAVKEKIRFGPAVALMTACGEGKIRAALPILRKVREKEGMTGQLADFAIARIADPEDLRITIEMLKRDPTARPPLDLYGDAVVPALLSEIEDRTLSFEIRTRFAAKLDLAARIGNCQLFEPLLTHRDPDVVRAAVRAFLKCPTSEDAPLVLRLLDNPNEEVRRAGLYALDDKVWNRELARKTIQILLNDKSDITRGRAAMVLETRREPLAREAFESALNDPFPLVRRTARRAIDALNSGRGQ